MCRSHGEEIWITLIPFLSFCYIKLLKSISLAHKRRKTRIVGQLRISLSNAAKAQRLRPKQRSELKQRQGGAARAPRNHTPDEMGGIGVSAAPAPCGPPPHRVLRPARRLARLRVRGPRPSSRPAGPSLACVWMGGTVCSRTASHRYSRCAIQLFFFGVEIKGHLKPCSPWNCPELLINQRIHAPISHIPGVTAQSGSLGPRARLRATERPARRPQPARGRVGLAS